MRAVSRFERTAALAPGNRSDENAPRAFYSERVPPLLSDGESAVALDIVGPSDRFDAETFARFARRPFLGFPPTVDGEAICEMERRGAHCELLCRTSPSFASPGQLAAEPNVLPPRERLSLEAIRPRPVVPSGTMFLWSVTPEATASDRAFVPTRPSAGFVLSRPPGVYSLDWIGVAITAPIR